jgi:N-acetyl sugar amidotransferase
MPDTRPGIVFDSEGVCMPCRNHERRKRVDWAARWRQLEELCDRHRGWGWDCVIAVSGGKDSHFQVHTIKNEMKMNPLLVSVDNFSWTETGRRNFQNISEAFGCDVISLSLNRRTARKMFAAALEEFGSPTWYWDRAVYTYPLMIAAKMGISLVVYGENVSYEYGGKDAVETPSARNQWNNTVANSVGNKVWKAHGITQRDLAGIRGPSAAEFDTLEPIYLSYFKKWDGLENLKVARLYGFQDLEWEWKREGYIENYDQIDAVGYLVHAWLKYPKYGHARTTDVASYWIRSGKIDRDEGMRLVREHDHKLDPKMLADFLDFTGYTESAFWGVVEKWWNRDLFEKVDGKWRSKEWS